MLTPVGMKNAKHILSIILSAVSMMTALLLAFLYAPMTARGIIQKVFYFHMPSAYTMYLAWGVCAVSSVLYLVKRTDRWDMLAKSAAELALLFAVMVMVTGSLWGRKAWGAFWTWDPRLTSSLLFTLVVAAYVLLRALASGETERRFSAALAILGACIVPVIHISVRKWRSQHPTVIRGGGMEPEMLVALIVSLFAFTGLFVLLLLHRYRLEESRRRLDALTERAAIRGLLGGDDG